MTFRIKPSNQKTLAEKPLRQHDAKWLRHCYLATSLPSSMTLVYSRRHVSSWKRQFSSRQNATYHQKCWVCHSPGCRDDLPSPSVDWLSSNHCIQDLKLHISYGCKKWIITKSTFSAWVNQVIYQARNNVFDHISKHREVSFIHDV